LDSAFAPWTDQWAFLASVRKISRSQVEQIVEDAERRGRILGVRLPPQSMRLSTYNKPRVVACAEDLPHHIGLPRGCLNDVRKTLIEPGVRLAIRDERCDGSRLEVRFRGELRREQKPAATAMLRHETGVLAATTTSGKTVVAAWLIAQPGVNTLVLVHRCQLLDQWVERLSTFLDVPAKSIGRIGGGRSRPTGNIDVGIIQSLVRKGAVDDRVAEYGHVIADECHHLSAHSFEQVIRWAKARFVRLVGNRRTQGRSPSDHLHAVRSGPTSGECSRAGGVSNVRTFRVGSADCFPADEEP
jgi:hypothetical protein